MSLIILLKFLTRIFFQYFLLKSYFKQGEERRRKKKKEEERRRKKKKEEECADAWMNQIIVKDKYGSCKVDLYNKIMVHSKVDVIAYRFCKTSKVSPIPKNSIFQYLIF